MQMGLWTISSVTLQVTVRFRVTMTVLLTKCLHVFVYVDGSQKSCF